MEELNDSWLTLYWTDRRFGQQHLPQGHGAYSWDAIATNLIVSPKEVEDTMDETLLELHESLGELAQISGE